MKHSLWLIFFTLPMLAGCDESSRVQRDFTEQRNNCQELAVLKNRTMPESAYSDFSENEKKRLIQFFSDCMNEKGWAIASPTRPEDGDVIVSAPLGVTNLGGPTSNENAYSPTPAPVPAPAQAAPSEPQTAEARDKKRAAECAFARQSASASVLAKKRAEACAAECTSQRNAGIKKPAACP